MTWLVWRRQRANLIVSVSIVLVLIGWWSSIIASGDLSGCGLTDGPRCRPDVELLLDNEFVFVLVMIALPMFLGAFAGAPLFAREYEAGTDVFVLSQDVSRKRWWWTKLTIAGSPLVVLMAVLGVVSVYGARTGLFHQVFSSPWYLTIGPVLGALTLLAFALAVTIGALSRNTIAALAGTVAAYAVVLGVIGVFVSPHLTTPYRYAVPMEWSAEGYVGPPEPPGRSEDTFPVDYGMSSSRTDLVLEGALCSRDTCSDDLDQVYVDYYRAGDIWRVQLADAAVYAAIALVVLGVGHRAVTRSSTRA
ncbi:hypothetical protein [Stackebrandtia soli]|uniref:hypothetical protein n=1 Tax=Stackebrandtia soli TaxID=1892856 RepID=UPI0039EB4C3D